MTGHYGRLRFTRHGPSAPVRVGLGDASVTIGVPNLAGTRGLGPQLGGTGGANEFAFGTQSPPSTPTHDWSSRVTLRIGKAADGLGFLDFQSSLCAACEWQP